MSTIENLLQYAVPSAENYRFRLEGIDFQTYGKNGINTPLEFNNLDLIYANGDRRNFEGINIDGDVSLILLYKGQPGFVLSFKAEPPDIWITQLQGGKRKGYRINTAFNVPKFFADRTLELLSVPENTIFAQILMDPAIAAFDQIVTPENTLATNRYLQLARLLEMKMNPDTGIYERKLANR